jgi:hypothetical protein
MRNWKYALGLVLTIGFVAAAPAVNMLVNPGFESGYASWNNWQAPYNGIGGLAHSGSSGAYWNNASGQWIDQTFASVHQSQRVSATLS